MKRKLMIITAVCISILSMTNTFAKGRTKETVELYRSSYQASSDQTGYGLAAKYYAKNNYSDTQHSISVACEAAWKGPLWPFTVEASMNLGIGKTGTKTVTQSKTSAFKVYLHGGYAKAHSYGEVTVTKK